MILSVSGAPQTLESEPTDPTPAVLSAEAVERILAIAVAKGIGADQLDAILGARLADSPPDLELEIIRQIKMHKASK